AEAALAPLSTISLVPEEDSKTTGRWRSDRRASCAGLLFKSKPSGCNPPTSPTSRQSGYSRRIWKAASTEVTGKHLRPATTAVTAVVEARITSTATTA